MYIYVTEEMFSYDLLALVKAFYPEEPHFISLEKEDNWEQYISLVYYDTEVEATFVSHNTAVACSKEPIDRQKRRYSKDSVKRALYRILSEVTGIVLPWGTLTGVRPTKLVMELVQEDLPKEQILSEMRTRYFVVEEKAKLGYQIVTKENELLHKIDYKNSYSVYIGIPFCPTTCLYCSFPSYALKDYSDYVNQYLEALFHEIDYAANCLPNKKLATIYIGGGTPTTLTSAQLERLLHKVKSTFDFQYVKEFTVEAGRPDSITKDKLDVMKRYGVTRISINPQTMKQETLDLIGRNHTVDSVRKVFMLAREAGHDNINMDLIAGLVNESVEDFQSTLEQIKALGPDSITVHSLVLKRAAMLNMQKDHYEEFTFGNVDKMIELGYEYADHMGMKPYYMYRQKNAQGSHNTSRENVGYAHQGKEGIYNILIMEEKHTILALGAGATSKYVSIETGHIDRSENVKNVREYVERIDEMIQRKRNFIEGD